MASVDEIVENVPKNVFLFLKSTNSSVNCLIEHLVREYFDYNVFTYFDPTKEHDLEVNKMSTLSNSYNNIIMKQNKFVFDEFLKTNFSIRAKLSYKLLAHIKKLLPTSDIKTSAPLIDKQLVPLIDLWLHGGYYFSVNTTFDNIKQTSNTNELFKFICDEISIDKSSQNEVHKNCRINFIKVHQFDCIVELAIKNYLLYYEKNKSYNFNRMFMNLYNNQNKMLSKKNKVSQNQYIICFKNKIKISKKHGNSIDFLFKFTDEIAIKLNMTSENSCPIINSIIKPIIPPI